MPSRTLKRTGRIELPPKLPVFDRYFSGGILTGESFINIGIGRLPEPSPAGPPGQSYPALLPAPVPESSSQALVAQPAALLGGPPVTVEVAATGLGQPDAVLPWCAPTSSHPASPNSGGLSGRGGGRGRGRGRGHRRTGYQNVATWPTQPEHGEGRLGGSRHSASLSTTTTTPSPSTLYVCFGFVSSESFSHRRVVVYSIDSVPNRPAHT